jgi:hypothetical protein
MFHSHTLRLTQASLCYLQSNVLWSCVVIPQPRSLGNPLQLITLSRIFPHTQKKSWKSMVLV